MSEQRVIKCDGCGREENYHPEVPGWSKWARLERPNWGGQNKVDLCPECIARIKEAMPGLQHIL